MPYTYVTYWNRMLIADWMQAGTAAIAVAKLLNRPGSTIRRELRH